MGHWERHLSGPERSVGWLAASAWRARPQEKQSLRDAKFSRAHPVHVGPGALSEAEDFNSAWVKHKVYTDIYVSKPKFIKYIYIYIYAWV